jgi:hypothetical protein
MSVAAFFDLNANAKFTSILSWAVARAQRVQMTRLDSTRRTVSCIIGMYAKMRNSAKNRSFVVEEFRFRALEQQRTVQEAHNSRQRHKNPFRLPPSCCLVWLRNRES